MIKPIERTSENTTKTFAMPGKSLPSLTEVDKKNGIHKVNSVFYYLISSFISIETAFHHPQ
ncbi:hypothetical protein BGP75_02335 [Motiliproteus sp. MSK22-1]|nr:hypothetical protein BGP75_02335 [Motiliproteus sp. MSK22-1]